MERHVDRREEERQEDGHLHQRSCLDGPKPHRNPARPEEPGDVDEQRQSVEPEEIDPAAADLHAHRERDDRQHRARDHPASERGEPVAEQDPAPLRRCEQQPPRKSVLEVAGDAEAREDAAERGGLEQHEDELERRVSGRVVEARHVLQLREAAGEGGEEEEREDQRRQEERRRRQHVLERAPRNTDRDRPDSHRASLCWSAQTESARETTAITAATPKPSASA